MKDDEDRYRAGIPAMSHAQYRALRRMWQRMCEDRGDNHDALVDRELETIRDDDVSRKLAVAEAELKAYRKLVNKLLDDIRKLEERE